MKIKQIALAVLVCVGTSHVYAATTSTEEGRPVCVETEGALPPFYAEFASLLPAEQEKRVQEAFGAWLKDDGAGLCRLLRLAQVNAGAALIARKIADTYFVKNVSAVPVGLLFLMCERRVSYALSMSVSLTSEQCECYIELGRKVSTKEVVSVDQFRDFAVSSYDVSDMVALSFVERSRHAFLRFHDAKTEDLFVLDIPSLLALEKQVQKFREKRDDLISTRLVDGELPIDASDDERVLAFLIKKYEGGDAVALDKLAIEHGYLPEFADLNPRTDVVCQSDSERRTGDSFVILSRTVNEDGSPVENTLKGEGRKHILSSDPS